MSNEITIPEEIITNKIYLIRGLKVMIDRDLAELYQVETKYLKRQTKRNITRFPDDFMFELTKEEHETLRSQFGTLKQGGHSKYPPYVFTEQGISMLSSVLNSDIAINVNIQIIRLFTKMREVLISHKDILLELEDMKKNISTQDERIDMVFDYLTKFITQEEEKEPIRKVGFKTKKG
ncbi:MAG: ORF6N domain-containing protein [Crocinitomix sp.]|nr:ORF6N domain-containing protein [Crocinitomix sp.]